MTGRPSGCLTLVVLALAGASVALLWVELLGTPPGARLPEGRLVALLVAFMLARGLLQDRLEARRAWRLEEERQERRWLETDRP